jgi:hypothetical protein
VTLDFEKEQAVQALCAHYAQDHLSTGELETRFERIYMSTSRSQLDTVLAGLPALQRADVATTPLYRVATGTGALPSNRKRYLAVFSGVKKEGAWEPAPEIEAKVIFGELVLDLRDAIIPPDGMRIELDVMFGEARVMLPPGVGAEVDASAIMGSVEDKAQRALPGAPVIRVRGGVLFGTIRVETKLPKPARMESWRQQIRAFLREGTGL